MPHKQVALQHHQGATGLEGLGYRVSGRRDSHYQDQSRRVIVGYVTMFVAVFWIMGLIVLLAVFASAMNERKK